MQLLVTRTRKGREGVVDNNTLCSVCPCSIKFVLTDTIIMVRWAMGGEPVGTPGGDIGGSKALRVESI